MRFCPLKIGPKDINFDILLFFGRKTVTNPRNTVFLFYKKLVCIKTLLQNPKYGGQNEVYHPKIGPKVQILPVFQFLQRNAVFKPRNVIFCHKQLYYLSTPIFRTPNGDQNQVYPVKLTIKDMFELKIHHIYFRNQFFNVSLWSGIVRIWSSVTYL